MKNKQQRTKNYVRLNLSLSAGTVGVKNTTRNHAIGKLGYLLGYLQRQPLLGHLLVHQQHHLGHMLQLKLGHLLQRKLGHLLGIL